MISSTTGGVTTYRGLTRATTSCQFILCILQSAHGQNTSTGSLLISREVSTIRSATIQSVKVSISSQMVNRLSLQKLHRVFVKPSSECEIPSEVNPFAVRQRCSVVGDSDEGMSEWLATSDVSLEELQDFSPEEVGGEEEKEGKEREGWREEKKEGEREGWREEKKEGEREGWREEKEEGEREGWREEKKEGEREGWREEKEEGEREGCWEEKKEGEREGWREEKKEGEREGWREEKKEGEREGWREEKKEGEREGWREEKKEGEREGWREEKKEGEREGWREEKKEGEREGWREAKREEEEEEEKEGSYDSCGESGLDDETILRIAEEMDLNFSDVFEPVSRQSTAHVSADGATSSVTVETTGGLSLSSSQQEDLLFSAAYDDYEQRQM